jgi:carbonic anhydrase
MVKGMVAGLFGGCSICSGLSQAFAAESHGAHWGYDGKAGPEHWGDLEAEFKSCALGTQQSPIDIVDAIPAEIGSIELSWRAVPLRIVNNGHTIQVNCEAGCTSRIAGTDYALLQFHFHHPSEHLVSGQGLPMEAHFVHKSSTGGLAVLGVFIRTGAVNDALAPVIAAMPLKQGPEQQVMGTMVMPKEMLPADLGYYRYHGSLTTPPCSEGVLWNVFREPIEASAAQIGRFAALFPMDARPVQSLNQRFVLESL